VPLPPSRYTGRREGKGEEGWDGTSAIKIAEEKMAIPEKYVIDSLK
jgi:hypothetical protein